MATPADEADGSLAPAGHEVFVLKAEIVADRLKDVFRLNRGNHLPIEFAERFMDGHDIYVTSGDAGMRVDARDGALKLADALSDASGDP